METKEQLNELQTFAKRLKQYEDLMVRSALTDGLGIVTIRLMKSHNLPPTCIDTVESLIVAKDTVKELIQAHLVGQMAVLSQYAAGTLDLLEELCIRQGIKPPTTTQQEIQAKAGMTTDFFDKLTDMIRNDHPRFMLIKTQAKESAQYFSEFTSNDTNDTQEKQVPSKE